MQNSNFQKISWVVVKKIDNTGIPRLVRFFGPQQTALLEKPHYLNTDLIVKVQFGTFEFSKSTFLPIFSIYNAILSLDD